MSLNWLHTSIYGPKNMLDEIKNDLQPHIHKVDDLYVKEDENGQPYLFTDTWEEKHLDEALIKTSQKYPNETLNIQCTASSIGAYHTVKSSMKNGIETIKEDTVETILSPEDDMQAFMDSEM